MSYQVRRRHYPFIQSSGCQSAGLHTADDRGEAPCHADPFLSIRFRRYLGKKRSRWSGHALEEVKKELTEFIR